MIKNVTLLPCRKKNVTSDDIRTILNILDARNLNVIMDESFGAVFANEYSCITLARNDDVFLSSELVIVMGGDGSIIDASRRAASFGIPVVGFNFGRLGFLAELDGNDAELLTHILDCKFETEHRMMLDVTVIRDGGEINLPYPCLNDVVLSNGPVSRLSSFDLYCDGSNVAKYSADGVIVSTPTGSSAYSMSAGGPLIYQTMECICVTPICPHSFTLRPVVFMDTSVLEIRNAHCRENSMYITVDGRDHIEIFEGDTVLIKKSPKVTKLVRVKDGGLLSVLNRKLSEMDNSSF